jgi:YidC/Oxa1 family membrane protein insertase
LGLDFLLPIWNPLIVHPLEAGLRAIATPLEQFLPPGLAGGLAIIIFTILLRLLLLPLSLVQIRSQRAQMAVQPELKALQRKFKGDREGLARAQMGLYKERGINPAAGCIPMLIQLPILFGMYSAMTQLATTGLTLDQVTQSQLNAGSVVYAAERHTEPYPYNQFVLARLDVIPSTSAPIQIDVDQSRSQVSYQGKPLLNNVASFTLAPGQAPGNPNPPSTPSGSASIFMRAGVWDSNGTFERNVPPVVGQPYIVEIWVDASGTNADSAATVVAWDPTLMQVTGIQTPELQDIAFKSPFLWLESLGQPDTFHIPGIPFAIPGLLLIIMTITSFLSQRMTTLPTDDPQQQAMMKSMAFMPLMYLVFFLSTPAGLVLYWLVSNVFTMFQQYFTIGLGLLGGDLLRITGHDYQPSWAHVPTTTPAPVAALAADGSNGHGDAVTNHRDSTTPGSGSTVAGATRRPRPGTPSRGRKRGKR